MTQKVTPGSPLVGPSSPLRQSGFVNAAIEVVDHWQQSKRLGAGGRPLAMGPPPTDTVRVKNTTGSAQLRGAVVQLGDYLHSTIDRFALTFNGDLPAEQAMGRYAILLEPLPVNGFGFAQVSGVCPTLINVIDEAHTHATPVASATVMDSAASGPCEILSPVDGTGEQSLVVRLGTSNTGSILISDTNCAGTTPTIEEEGATQLEFRHGLLVEQLQTEGESPEDIEGHFAIDVDAAELFENVNGSAEWDTNVDLPIDIDEETSGDCTTLRPFLDVSAIPGYSSGDFQVLIKEAGGGLKLVSVAAVLKELTGWVAGNDQSIGHDEDADPEWQDDGDCEAE